MDASTSSPADTTSHEHIVLTPGICGGKPRIAGSRIRVQDVMIWHERMGRSAEEIVRDFPQLTLAQIYSALAYYYDHRAEVDAQLEADDALVESLRAQFPSLLPRSTSGRPE